MTSAAGSQVAKTRSQRFAISAARVKLAKKAQVGEVLALESADDDEGFSFWLVRVEEVAFVYSGQKRTEDGVVFVSGGYYIKVRYYERFPPSSPSTFKLSASVITENAEGVIARQVPSIRAVRRSRRHVPNTDIITLSKDTIAYLSDLPSLDSM